MASKKPLQSRTLWYTAISAVGVVLTYLLADESFNTVIGSTGVLILFVIDKLVTAYLRGITTKPIKRKSNLEVLDEPNQSDDDYTKDF